MQTEVFLSLTTQGRTAQTDKLADAVIPDARDFAETFLSLSPDRDVPGPVIEVTAPDSDPEPEAGSDGRTDVDDSSTGAVDSVDEDPPAYDADPPVDEVEDQDVPVGADAGEAPPAEPSLLASGFERGPMQDMREPVDFARWADSGTAGHWRAGPGDQDRIAELAWADFSARPWNGVGNHQGSASVAAVVASEPLRTETITTPARTPPSEVTTSHPGGDIGTRPSGVDVAPPPAAEQPGTRAFEGGLAHPVRTSDATPRIARSRDDTGQALASPPTQPIVAQARSGTDELQAVQTRTPDATGPTMRRAGADANPAAAIGAGATTASAAAGTHQSPEHIVRMPPATSADPGPERVPRSTDTHVEARLPEPRTSEHRAVGSETGRPDVTPVEQRRNAAAAAFPAEPQTAPRRAETVASPAPDPRLATEARNLGEGSAPVTGKPDASLKATGPDALSERPATTSPLPREPGQHRLAEADAPVTRQLQDVAMRSPIAGSALANPAAPSPDMAMPRAEPEADHHRWPLDAPAARQAPNPDSLTRPPAQRVSPEPGVIHATAKPATRSALPLVSDAAVPGLPPEPFVPSGRDAAPVPAGLPATPAQQATLARDVAQQLATVTRGAAGDVTELTLRPEELGQVRMRFSGTDGQIVLQILSERPETHDLMRRHIDIVERAFRDLGYSDIAFDFGTPGQQGQSAPGNTGDSPEALPDEPGAAQPQSRPQSLAAGRLDIRL